MQNTAGPGSPIFDKGASGWEQHEKAGHHIEKRVPSASAGTDLADWIADRQIDTLTVIGYMTHNCVDSMIKHTLHDGLAIEYLPDASGSIPHANR